MTTHFISPGVTYGSDGALCSPRNALTREQPFYFVNRPQGVHLPLLRQRASLGIAPLGTGYSIVP